MAWNRTGICAGCADLIGNTPMMELSGYSREAGVTGARLLAKLEFLNPAGSVKDRVAKKMIEAAEAEGILKPGGVIIEPTSGNTGIGLAAVAAAKGYRAVFVLPDTMSMERRLMLTAYGAEVELTPGAEGMKGAIRRAEELCRETPGAWIPAQFDNPANAQAHYETTGPEIWDACEGRIDVLVAGVGTGGTITGTGRYLKERNPKLHIIAVEPANSPILSGGDPGAHGLQGIGAGFVPAVLDTDVYDEVVRVTEEDAYAAGKRLARTEGILNGISAGAALHAASETAKRPEYAGKTIVVILPDSGDRYLSTPLFA